MWREADIHPPERVYYAHILVISQCNTLRRLGNYSSLSEYNIPPET
jgi:hypothetical protein